MSKAMRIMIVDDEAPARMRMNDLLADIRVELPNEVLAEAGDGEAALAQLASTPVDVMLVDVRMPNMGGEELAQRVAELPHAPAIIFTTAYDEYAVKAFELAALDYLLKPVRASRLQAALRKVQRLQPEVNANSSAPQFLHSNERGRMLRIAVADILYLRAELKYVTARTAEREYVLEESLQHLEELFEKQFVRVHRNCLVAKDSINGYERVRDTGDGADPQWSLMLRGIDERIPVSRRQWAQVKALIKGEGK